MPSSNQLVTWTDLNSFLNPKAAGRLSGDKIATKLEISTHYYVDETASPWQYYTDERCPAYQYIIPSGIYCNYYAFTTFEYEDSFYYTDCDGVPRYVSLNTNQTLEICALNDPYPYAAGGFGSVNYISYCPFNPQYNFYLANGYICNGSGGCIIDSTSQLLAFPLNFTPNSNSFYKGETAGVAYQVTDVTTQSSPFVIMYTVSYDTCAQALGC
jgi:hypothetical protein